MNNKVRVIRKSNKVLVKAGMSVQYPITGGIQLVAGGNDERSKRSKSAPVRVGGGVGAGIGGGLGALSALGGQHRSLGSLVQSAISGHAQGKQIGRGLGENTGAVLSALASRDEPTEDRLNRRFGIKPSVDKPQPTGEGKVKVTDSSRTTDASIVGDSQANRVLDALGNIRVLAADEKKQQGKGPVYIQNPLANPVTGNPLPKRDMSTISPEQKADLERRMNPQNRTIAVESSHPVQTTVGDWNTPPRGAIDNPQMKNSIIGQMGLGASAATPPPRQGATGEQDNDLAAANQLMNLDTTPDQNLPSARTGAGGKVTPLERRNSPLAGTSADTPSPNQREANNQYRRLEEIQFSEAFPNYNDPDALVNTGEPMDIAFRLLKMMRFYR